MKFTPHGKFCIGLIVCALFGVYIAGFIHGATAAVRSKAHDDFGAQQRR